MMEVLASVGLCLVASLVLGGVRAGTPMSVAGARAPAASSAAGSVHIVLTGYVREGRFPNARTSKPTRYLYLELDKPVGSYVSTLPREKAGLRDIELVGGSTAIIRQLESLVGKKVTVQGKLPFTFDANAPSVTLPIVMLLDTSNPQLFK